MYTWTTKTDAIMLKEMKTIIRAFESMNYTEKQIIKELKDYDIHIKL